MKASDLQAPAQPRRLAPKDRRRLLADAHRDFSEAISRYWDAHEVDVSIGALPVADLEEEGVILRTQRFQLLVTPPTQVTWNHWRAFLMEDGTTLWRAVFNGYFSAIETILIGTANALKRPAQSPADVFAAARDSAVIAIQGKRGRFGFMKRLGMTLGEYALALGVPPQRVVLWHRRLGMILPSSSVNGNNARLIDKIRDMVVAGRSRDIARTLQIQSSVVFRALGYLALATTAATTCDSVTKAHAQGVG